jgi:tryptophanyl-tRNA synthetase
MPGLDGQKMSKSYGNTITLREDADSVTKKIRTMQTDPARVRRTDAGDPDKCPVWQFHRDLLRMTRSRPGFRPAAVVPASAASNASSR